MSVYVLSDLQLMQSVWWAVIRASPAWWVRTSVNVRCTRVVRDLKWRDVFWRKYGGIMAEMAEIAEKTGYKVREMYEF